MLSRKTAFRPPCPSSLLTELEEESRMLLAFMRTLRNLTPCSPLRAPRPPTMSLRIAVIGSGRLGSFHAQKLARMAGVELVGRCRSAAGQPRPSGRRVAHYGICPSHEPLVGKIDAAVIATPTVSHHRVAVDFLKAGTHLLVEKPLSATLPRPTNCVEMARRRKVVLQVGHVERFNPALGRQPRRTWRSRSSSRAVRASGFTFRSMDIGVVLDLMIHDIDLVLSLVASPLRSVDALGVSLLGGHEDAAHARLTFACGCVANLSASRISYEPVRKNAGLGRAGLCQHRLRHADDDARAAQRGAASR